MPNLRRSRPTLAAAATLLVLFSLFFSSASAAAAARVNDDHQYITYSGHWTNNDSSAGYVNSDQHFSSTAGAYAQFTFSGTSIKWIGPRNIDCGKSEVYIDDVLKATVDMYAPTWLRQQILYSNDSLSNSQHTIRIVATSSKSASSIGYYSSIDAFEFDGWPGNARNLALPATAESPSHRHLTAAECTR